MLLESQSSCDFSSKPKVLCDMVRIQAYEKYKVYRAFTLPHVSETLEYQFVDGAVLLSCSERNRRELSTKL